ncbi:hypothetical protein HNR23_002747 [Nocardiopsis mwathae]|uniref:Uncharacterized protein n=1 Tax=Nocardiopsis mwathae TaxID=1472723 RepID=A0A7W9YIE7_9ACTN|nr:hypothetical protein [Nocardiopsis mwathae]MBB6172687.1 hypothetical protein [Nocardiopsis mwathae]
MRIRQIRAQARDLRHRRDLRRGGASTREAEGEGDVAGAGSAVPVSVLGELGDMRSP